FGRAPSSRRTLGSRWNRILGVTSTPPRCCLSYMYVPPLLSDFKNLSKEYCIGLGYGESIAAPLRNGRVQHAGAVIPNRPMTGIYHREEQCKSPIEMESESY